MQSWFPRCVGSCVLVVAVLFPLAGRAQDTGDDAGVAELAPPQLVAPQLIAQIEASYPPEALEQRLEASVLLALTIDETGAVTAADVLEPGGHGFDEAARAAALQFRFSPAARAGLPMAARIRYRYTFALPPEPVPVAVPVPAPAPPVVPTPPAATPLTASGESVEVSVHGARSEAQQLVESAESVSVVDLRIAKQQTADLGEVLARTPGISVEREAGLGSATRISLAGLQGSQVKIFVDGVPIEESGYPGLADIPVNLIERLEIYRGVVPIRFGTDALGGVINVVTNRTSLSHLGGSYQVGAFNTHRATVVGRYQDAELDLTAGGSLYLDYTENSYEIDVNSPGPDGRPVNLTVPRKHDDYRSAGGAIDVGLVDRRWARRLTLTGFVNSTYKEYQSNANQTVPYGELRASSREYGATLRYEVDLAPNVALELVANYQHNHTRFIDLAEWVYDWSGNRVRPRKVGGEVDARRKSDLRTWEDAVFGRLLVQWSVTHDHILRFSTSPSSPWRGGHEVVVLEEGQRDKGDGMRRMLTVVSGVEYEANLFDERLSNSVFLKHYWQYNTGEDPLYFVPGDVWQKRENYTNHPGFGDSLRFCILPWLYAKGSYEYAARLPEPEEYLGDARLIGPNYDLKPERSHNGNLGLRAEGTVASLGEGSAEVNGFVRSTDDLILLVGLQGSSKAGANLAPFSSRSGRGADESTQFYANVQSTRSLGIDTAVTYLSPGRYLGLNGMVSWQDLRNTSGDRKYKPFKGERIPSRPWLFASWGARLSFPDLLMEKTRLEPFYDARYVHSYNRGWDNYGDPQFKIVMPSQLTHSVGVTWVWSSELAHLTLTLELDNLADAKLYDYFGAQRAGRAFYVKVTGDLR